MLIKMGSGSHKLKKTLNKAEKIVLYNQVYTYIKNSSNTNLEDYIKKFRKQKSYFVKIKKIDSKGYYILQIKDYVSHGVNKVHLFIKELNRFYVGQRWTRIFQVHYCRVISTDSCYSKATFDSIIFIIASKNTNNSLILLNLRYTIKENKQNWDQFIEKDNMHLNNVFSSPNLAILLLSLFKKTMTSFVRT